MNKYKILLLSDDMRQSSGIATMSREFVRNTADVFDWVQLGAAIKHPEHGKVFDVSDDVKKSMGYENVSVKIYAHDGYGNPEVLREIISLERPSAILHFTDPRFWGWLYSIEHEVRSVLGVPIMYYNIWDCPPAPYWNKPFYQSCDLIMNISKQTHQLVKMVLGEGEYTDMDTTADGSGVQISYVPHGIDSNVFYPITPTSKDYDEYVKFMTDFKTAHDVNFIVFWNNRNVRRKQPGDVVLAFRKFCDYFPIEQSSKFALVMHTSIVDEHGTHLPEVVRVACPNYKVIFNDERLPPHVLNYFYNLADVTLNISSNEGFGLATAESVMAGTPIVVNVTGGLQDQCGFVDDDGNPMVFSDLVTSNHTGIYQHHGSWVIPVFPSNRSLQGSVPTPYIFDDRCSFSDVADAIKKWYLTPIEDRKAVGMTGREWMISKETGMSSIEMGNRMRDAILRCLKTFKPAPKYRIYQVKNVEKVENCGIIW